MELTRRQMIAGALGGALAGAASGPASAATGAGPAAFRRGGGIHNMMNWGKLVEGSRTRYTAFPFDTERNRVPDLFLLALKVAGLDYIRLTVDVGPFLQASGATLDALDARLEQNVRLLHAAGLDVVVDLHPVEQVPDYSVQAILADLDGSAFRAYTALVARLARRLSTRPFAGRVALELMNEPAIDGGDHRLQIAVWNAAQLVLHDAARQAAPTLPLVLTGGHWGGIAGLVDLDPEPYAASEVLYSFHYYFPIAFTHQGMGSDQSDAPYRTYVVDLPYPARARRPDAIFADLEARIAGMDGFTPEEARRALREARKVMNAYLAEDYDRAKVARDLKRVTDWAAKTGVDPRRVVMGEWGATRRGPDFLGAEPASRARFYREVRETAEAAGFRWAVWDVRGRDFGIHGGADGLSVDPAIAVALGLSA